MSTFDQPLPPFNASDPSASFLSSSCLDFLLIEIVPMAYRVANEVDAAASAESIPKSSSGGVVAAETTGATASTGDGTAAARASGRLDEEEERDAVFYRLETLGYRVGLGLVERYGFLSFTRNKQHTHPGSPSSSHSPTGNERAPLTLGN